MCILKGRDSDRDQREANNKNVHLRLHFFDVHSAEKTKGLLFTGNEDEALPPLHNITKPPAKPWHQLIGCLSDGIAVIPTTTAYLSANL